MVRQDKVTNLVAGRSRYAIPSAQLTVTDMSRVSPSLVSHRLLVFQPVPNRAPEVVKKEGFE